MQVIDIPNQYDLSLKRLKFLQCHLMKNPEILTEYDQIIRDQLSAGIIETVSEPSLTESNGHIHYLPHHAIIRQGRQTTKIRIVYDGSAKGLHDAYLLNDCLQTGPNFIPKLFNTLIKFRTHLVALVADIEKAFLMIRISESHRNMLRFIWLEEPINPNGKLIHLRFTRLVFGLRLSPAILQYSSI